MSAATESPAAVYAQPAWQIGTTVRVRTVAKCYQYLSNLWSICARRMGSRRERCSELMSIISRLEIGKKNSLLIVAWGERRFLVANNAEALTVLLEIAGPSQQARKPQGTQADMRRRASRRQKIRVDINDTNVRRCVDGEKGPRENGYL